LNKFDADKKLDAYDRVVDMNYNNEIFEINSIYIIRVICYMYWVCMRACVRARVHTEEWYINITYFK